MWQLFQFDSHIKLLLAVYFHNFFDGCLIRLNLSVKLIFFDNLG